MQDVLKEGVFVFFFCDINIAAGVSKAYCFVELSYLIDWEFVRVPGGNLFLV